MKPKNRKMVICKGCGTHISKLAKECPHCGEPSTAKKMMQISIGIMALGFLLIVGVPILIFIIAMVASVNP